MVDWLQDSRIDGKTTGAIYNTVQPLYKASEDLK